MKKLDNQILDLIGGLDSEDLDVLIEREIEESDRFRRELNQVLLRLEEVLNPSASCCRISVFAQWARQNSDCY